MLLHRFLLTVLAWACLSGCPRPSTPPPQDNTTLWRATTTPYPPACDNGACTSLHQVNLAHVDETVDIRFDPRVDDPVAQWADCLQQVFDCVKADGPTRFSICVTGATLCPTTCRQRYTSTLAGGEGDLTREKTAFKAVYLDHSSSCRALRGTADAGVAP